MGQTFLVSGSLDALNDIRNTFLSHSEICVPHKENGCWYGDVSVDDDGDEWVLCVLDDAVQYLTSAQSSSLVVTLPDNFVNSII